MAFCKDWDDLSPSHRVVSVKLSIAQAFLESTKEEESAHTPM
jgi:hypothetical protein